MSEVDELAQLEELLSADIDDHDDNTIQISTSVREIDLFQQNNDDSPIKITSEKPKSSAIHDGDTDSSDDEEKRNYTERKYNEYGSQIKKLMDTNESEKLSKKIEFEVRLRQANESKASRSFTSKPETPNIQSNIKNFLCAPDSKSKKTIGDIYTDPVFYIRITKPLISSSALLDRMQGREAVNMLRVKRYVENEDLAKDWVIAGVIVKKSAIKKSQKGNQFMVWTLSDLRDDLKTVSMFLFRKAYNDLWKTSEGTVVAVLNPSVLDKSQNSADQACLSVESSDRVMILGQSKDLGFCKSKKKNGEPCTAFVNTSQGDYCIYHVKQEYQKYSKRQELQSSTMGKGLVNLQNKVLGKSEVMYGGKIYTALPSANNKKVKERDQNRLMSLSDYYKSEGETLMSNKAPYGAGAIKNNSGILHSPSTQRKSDYARLNQLSNGNSNKTELKPTTSLADKVSNSKLGGGSPTLKEKVASSPLLGQSFSLKGSGTIDLSMSYGQKKAERTKANAIRLIQQNGGLEKIDPNNLKGTQAGKKRAIEKLNDLGSSENESKKSKPNTEEVKTTGIKSERFKKILEATSAHQNLIEQHEDEQQEKYFNKLEKKEAMEEKMLNTFKLACKAVRCVKCKYTAFSASQLCKDERHPLKVLDTFKRFFKCLDCSNRTVSLDLIPLHSCGNCGSSRWEKAPMMREKKNDILCSGLSIRGEEESYIGGQVTAGKNINLLVPDSDS